MGQMEALVMKAISLIQEKRERIIKEKKGEPENQVVLVWKIVIAVLNIIG